MFRLYVSDYTNGNYNPGDITTLDFDTEKEANSVRDMAIMDYVRAISPVKVYLDQLGNYNLSILNVGGEFNQPIAKIWVDSI